MGRRGRPATPTAILKARGSWHAKGREGEPEVSEPLVESPPEWLTDDAALECWRRVRPLVTWMRATDSNLFARYCETWGHYRARVGELAASVTIDSRCIVEQQCIKLREQLLRMEAQIGLTPSARTGIRVDDKPKNKSKIRLIQGQRKRA